MNWSEAFRRAIMATLWMVLFFIIFGVVIGIGMVLGVFDVMYGDGDYNFGLMIFGVIIVIIGYIGILFATMAVFIKTFTDSVTDNVMKRLYPTTQQPPQQTPRQ